MTSRAARRRSGLPTPLPWLRGGTRLRNLKFRSKMAVAVALPLCALLAVTIAGLVGRERVVSTETRVGHLYGPAGSLAEVVVALDDEARLSNWVLAGGDTSAQDRLRAARVNTDRAISQVRREASQLERARADAAAVRLAALFDQFDLLGEQRRFVDLQLLPVAAATGYFEDTVGGALRVLDAMNGAVHYATEVANLRDFTTAVRFVAAVGAEHTVLTGGFARGTLSDEQVRDLTGAIASQDAYQALFLSQAGPTLRTAFEQRYQPGSNVVNRVHAMRSVALAGHLRGGTVTVSDWYGATTAQRASMQAGARNVLRAVHAGELSRKRSAEQAMLLYGLGAGAALLAALALAYAIVRSTTGPLRRLTDAARDVSERQLPRLLHTLHDDAVDTDFDEVHPIELSSRDEVGELAHAFNSIETATVAVAREHAALLRQGISDLYVNLARRNQSLLERQLRVIDDLEAQESRSETLAALFRLDHFATRMRRNAESLLILAGVDLPRPTATAIRIFDVARAAASEIDDYTRVELTGLDETTEVVGRVTMDLTHLLAELLENATAFSPPGSPVVVSGEKKDATYLVSVTDRGLGMTPDALAAANDVLRRPPPTRLALSRSLGLLVVSRLAARAGMRVELVAGSPGLTAVVTIPPDLLITREGTGSAPPAPADPAALGGRSRATLPRRRPVAPPGETSDAPARTAASADDATAAARVDATAEESASQLPKRVRKAQLQTPRPRGAVKPRSADAAFELVARYEAGRRRGLLDAVSGAAGATGDASDIDALGPAVPEREAGGTGPDILPRRTPHATPIPARSETVEGPDPRSADKAFEVVARYEWGRRRAQIDTSPRHGEPDGSDGVEAS